MKSLKSWRMTLRLIFRSSLICLCLLVCSSLSMRILAVLLKVGFQSFCCLKPHFQSYCCLWVQSYQQKLTVLSICKVYFKKCPCLSVCLPCVCVPADCGKEGWGGEWLPEGQHRAQAGLLPCQPAAGDLRRSSRHLIHPAAHIAVSSPAATCSWPKTETLRHFILEFVFWQFSTRAHPKHACRVWYVVTIITYYKESHMKKEKINKKDKKLFKFAPG